MQYQDDMTTKEISKKLNMSEGTVKSILSRGKIKLRKTIKPATIFMIIIGVLISSVIAATIIKYIIGLFDTSDVGIDNDGILMAIEHMEWYQEVDMNYIDLGDGYKMRVDYLLMDEMNLYMVVDLESEKDISEYDEFSLNDLRIVDNNGNLICNVQDALVKQYSTVVGNKIINKTNNSMKILVYMYTDRFPISKELNINFSKVLLTKKLNIKNVSTKEVNIKINLDEKFINRTSVTYICEDEEIEKAIITETGFYAIVKSNKRIQDVELININGIEYKCYFNTITSYYDNSNMFKYIITSNFNNKEIDKFNLKINQKNFELKK